MNIKRIYLLPIIAWSSLLLYSQSRDERIVERFGTNMQSWTTTMNEDYLDAAKGLCSERCRVKDEIVLAFASKSLVEKMDIDGYRVESYLHAFQKLLRKGNLLYALSNVKAVQKEEMAFSGSYGSETAAQEARRAEKFTVVECDVLLKGAMNKNASDLFYLIDGEIVKITPCEYRTDPRTGKRKIQVDFSDLVDEHSIEVSYGYSSQNPLNIALSTNLSFFHFGLEYGQSFSSDPLRRVQHKNFGTSTIDGNHFYLLASPGVFLRYVSVDCGLGAVFTKYKYTSVYSDYSENKVTFMMKPKLTANLPVPRSWTGGEERWYICPHVAYQYVPKFGRLNCWEVGIGIRYRFETY